MSQEKEISRKVVRSDQVEQRGIVQDVSVPIAAGGAGGAAAGATEAFVSHLLNRPNDPPTPTVELPPGVDPN